MATTSVSTTEFLKEFIKLYRSRPCLWDRRSADHWSPNARARAFDELMIFCSASYPDTGRHFAKSLIHCLKSGFWTECGRATSGVSQPGLWYYELLQFLKEDLAWSQGGDENRQDGSDENSKPGSEDCSPSQNNIDVQDKVDPTTENNENSATTPALVEGTEPEAEDGAAVWIGRIGGGGRLDEFDIVGMMTAAKLRRMKWGQRIVAESLINQVLTKGLHAELTRNASVVEDKIPR